MNTDRPPIVAEGARWRSTPRVTVTAVVAFALATGNGCASDTTEPASGAGTSGDTITVTASAPIVTGTPVATESDVAVTAAPTSVQPTGGADATATSPTTAAGGIPAAPVGGPVTDPCALLTPDVAAAALGVPVGDPTTQPGEGNSTCSYAPADGSAKGFVLLTTYAVTGTQAVLDGAAQEFPGAIPVDGVGDAARVSVQAQVIGVLSGDVVFARSVSSRSHPTARWCPSMPSSWSPRPTPYWTGNEHRDLGLRRTPFGSRQRHRPARHRGAVLMHSRRPPATPEHRSNQP